MRIITKIKTFSNYITMGDFSYNRNAAARKIQRAVRSRQSRKKSGYTKNKSAKSQANQIYNNAKQINKLYKKIRNDGRDYFNYYNTYSEVCPKLTDPIIGYGYNIQRVINTSNWNSCLDIPTAAQANSGMWKILNSKIQMRVTLSEELNEPVKVTVYHIKIKPHMYDIATRNWGSSLAGFFTPALPDSSTPSDLSPNPIFVSATGHTWLNKSYFKILGMESFNLSARQYGTPPPPEGNNTTKNLGDSYKELYFKISYGKRGINLDRGRGSIEQALDTSSTSLNRNAQSFLLVVSNAYKPLESEEPLHITTSILHTLCTK